MPALEESFVDRERKRINVFAGGVFAFVVGDVFMEFAAGDGAIELGTSTAAIGEEVTGALRFEFGLILHIEAGASGEERRRGKSDRR
jgi:hypothetical protein